MKLVLLLCGKNQIYQENISNFFGKRLILPEYCITELGHTHFPPTSDSIILDDKKNISGQDF